MTSVLTRVQDVRYPRPSFDDAPITTLEGKWRLCGRQADVGFVHRLMSDYEVTLVNDNSERAHQWGSAVSALTVR